MRGLETVVSGSDSVSVGPPAPWRSPERGGTTAESDVCGGADYSSD